MYTLQNISEELKCICNTVQKVMLEKKARFTNCYCTVLAESHR